MTIRKIARPTALLAAAALAVTLAACSSTSSTPDAAPTTTTATTSSPALKGTLTVFAAASLKATFTDLANAFMTKYPDVSVQTSFAGSSDLVSQITEGAPADVFASADVANMTKLTSADLIAGQPVNFATNVLEIAVPPGNPANITSFADLAKPGVQTVICAAEVPCGSATVAVEKAAGVTLAPVSEEQSVTDVLAKVESGEADAGVVYVTDVAGAGDKVDGVNFPESSGAVNTYPIGVVKGDANPDAAQAFIDMVTGPDGQAVLSAAGFGKP